MSKQQTQTELLKEQSNLENESTNKESSSEELEYNKEYQETGIWIRGNETTGYYITVGNWKVSNIYTTPGEAKELLDNRNYDLIMRITLAQIHHTLMHILPPEQAQKLTEPIKY